MKKGKKIKQGTIIKLTWLDAFGRGTWATPDSVENGLKNHITCEIVGYYITEDKNYYVLCMGVQDDIDSAPFLKLEFIPKGSVIKLSELNEKS